jgi:colanic acid biosynthesis glycosyl transferase WcaI
MKVLFVSENFPPETNAAATRVYERALYWIADGHQVTVVTSAPNFPTGRLMGGYANRWHQVEDMDGIRVVRVKTFMAPNRGRIARTLDFLSFMVSGFAAGLFEDRPDVVAATSPQFFAAVTGWALAAARRRPFVFELGDLWPESISAVGAVRPGLALRCLERLELFLYRRAAAVAALSPAFKKNLVGRGIPPGKIAVVMNGVDIDRYGPRPPDEELAREWNLAGRFVVGYMGTHGMAHALDNVLDAAEALAEEDQVRFLLVGAGAERDALIAEGERRGLTNVVFAPAQAKERMAAVWSLCDVALVHLKDLPLFTGVIPSKLFEAMGMGLPILLAAPVGEAARIVRDHDCGLCVPAQDPDALVAAVRRLHRDEALRRDLGERSHAAAPAHSRRRQAEEMMRVLTLASEGRGGEAAP